MKFTINQTAYLPNPADLVQFKEADQKTKVKLLYVTDTDMDMENSGWLKVGNVESTFRIEIDYNDATRKAVASINEKIKDLEDETADKVAVLREGIHRLLALPAPGQSEPVPEQFVEAESDWLEDQRRERDFNDGFPF